MDDKFKEQIIRCNYCLAPNPRTAIVCEKCGKFLREPPQKIKEQIIRCNYCLAPNPRTATVCEKCGKSLTKTPQSNPVDTLGKSKDSVNFDGDISNTITGLLLLGIGTALLWIPVVQYLGIILNFIGVILIFLNRGNFEAKHGTYVVLSIVIYIISFLISLTTVIIGSTGIVTSSFASLSISQEKSMIRNYMQTIIIAAILAGVISSFAFFTITYGLQDKTGKILLRIGLISYFAVETIIGVVLNSSFTSALNNIFSGNSFNQSALNTFEQTVTIYSLLTVIPMVTYAIAFLRIRGIINDNA